RPESAAKAASKTPSRHCGQGASPEFGVQPPFNRNANGVRAQYATTLSSPGLGLRSGRVCHALRAARWACG
ncbi:MAG: hypothetical protein WBF93_09910, partial [Pirellulales bacterium]